MKTWVSIILVLAALVLVTFALLRYPAYHRPAEAVTPPEALPASEPVVGAATPNEAVVAYVEALNRKDYRAAWEDLSQKSKETHPYDEFVDRAETGQSTDLDLAAATEGKEHNGQVIVTVPMVEDPAEAAFTTVEEPSGWKVIYIGGEPWFPYPTPGAEVPGPVGGEKGSEGG
jgi:hypothetical protein